MWHEGGRYAGLLPAEFPVQPGQAHETFEAKRRLKSLLDVSALAEHLHAIRPREATRDELLRAHGPDYLDRLERANGEYAAIVGLGARAGLRLPIGRVWAFRVQLEGGGLAMRAAYIVDGQRAASTGPVFFGLAFGLEARAP